MSATFEFDQPQILSILWGDKTGQPTTAPVGVVPSWTASDTSVLTLTAAPGGQTCAAAGLKAGSVTVTMTAGPIVATLVLTLTPGVPVAAQIIVSPVPVA